MCMYYKNHKSDGDEFLLRYPLFITSLTMFLQIDKLQSLVHKFQKLGFIALNIFNILVVDYFKLLSQDLYALNSGNITSL